MRFKRIDTVLYICATLMAFSFPLIGKADDIKNPALVCPELNLEALAGQFKMTLKPDGLRGPEVLLRFLWSNDKRSPQMSLQSGLFNRALSDIFRFFQSNFNQTSFPVEINIVQTDLGDGIGALYCRSYQTNPDKSVTLFLSPKTLESTNEFTRLIAHELTHHWFFQNEKQAAGWIEEGVAYLSEYLVTGRLSGQPVIQYLTHSNASLTITDPKAPMRQMGHAQLLFVYLYEKLGIEFLNNLLSSEMNGIETLNQAIPINNPYHWRSFKDAFKDFQIAKYLNRQDYWAMDNNYFNRYFLFPTTIRARNSSSNKWAEWSAQEFKEINISKLNNIEYEDIVVIDDPREPISVKPLGENIIENSTRVFRIFYNFK